MNKVHILDCTLRDGGYCNQWQFGYNNAKKITAGLVESGVDIIECGFLTDKVSYDKETTRFNSVEQISEIIPKNREGKVFAAMINYGEYTIEKLPVCNGKSIDGIRVAFHKKDLSKALDFCEQIKEKGYKVFIQAMVSLCYSDEEFLTMIRQINEFEPYAFYIVDSFGMMKGKDLIRLFYLVEHNLKKSVWVGFHSHNNMQLAYSNAQSLVNVHTNRNLIIDSCVYGMGRGAGNLNTELFIEFLNENYNKKYSLRPLLIIIDEILNGFYQRNNWGYSLPNYISAIHNTHPDYAGYLDDKKTLTVGEMNEIFDMINADKRFSYDKEYIEDLYIRYMTSGKVNEDHARELQNAFAGKNAVLIAPGKSSVEQKELIISEAHKENTILISVNYEYQYVPVDYVFISNLRRFKELDQKTKEKCIVTSNISSDSVYFKVRYSDLVNSIEAVKDNAGLMAIKFLKSFDINQIMLAGFDGYSHDVTENYANSQMEFITRNAVLDAMNAGMTAVLRDYASSVNISFLTEPKHIKL